VRLGRRVRHVRRLEWSGGEVVVHDRLDGIGRHRIESRLHWAPRGDERAEVTVYGPGERREEAGWVSERFGERVETRVLAVGMRVRLPAELGFRVRGLQ
jgi:hypothetical protein